MATIDTTRKEQAPGENIKYRLSHYCGIAKSLGKMTRNVLERMESWTRNSLDSSGALERVPRRVATARFRLVGER
jgi:hypothetical protein